MTEHNLTACMDALKKNRMNVLFVESRDKVAQVIENMLPDGATIACGGSVTLGECGVYDVLKKDKYTYYDRAAARDKDDEKQIMQKAYNSDFYISGANAITETGTVYNVDGRANRVSAMCFGAKKVIIVAGINKIVPTVADAVYRVKTVAAPKNCRRLGMDTYCAKTGKCASLTRENPEMTDGCSSPSRICCDYLLLSMQREPGRITVILVNEELGY